MPVTIIIGAQWGDEGKGRAVDWLAAQADVVARFSGGDNAGHTVYVGDEVFKMHLIPSGILHPQALCVLGNGMVINPVNLLKEIDMLREMGVDISPSRLKISSKAHLITPAHIALDAANEKARGKDAIGTTLRGIGPAYLDKTGRKGIRAGEMRDLEAFGELIRQAIQSANQTLAQYDADLLDAQSVAEAYVQAAHQLRPYLADTTYLLNQKLKAGANVLCEGAQGTLLDVDHGSYPFVTSSNPTIGGALAGLGIGARYVQQVIGVAKCFSTRVGSGPMPTELDGDIANRLRGTGENFWDEYGTTTGRPRRCGWLDAVMLRYSCDVNGYTSLAVTKMDILSGFDELKIAVAYEVDGVQVDYPPDTVAALERAKPIYETFPGWEQDITNARSFSDLPLAAQNYLKRIGELCDVPIAMISVGPEREQFIVMEQVLAT
ncbi:MAG: adenylosuccinate synthase [Phototrophicales bacterium]|nr:MAG: adenylosuccinate synthase [Phototrophicales bacterium]RMG73309.1 MAG: adenylosuccinate synthase [Chloroflexota bacterium]